MHRLLINTPGDFCGGFYCVAPFGALVFVALGDLIGRKYTFLANTRADGRFHVPHRPNSFLFQHRLCGPILVLILRLVQGLALGGEYGGAATLRMPSTRPWQAGAAFLRSWIRRPPPHWAVSLIRRNCSDQKPVGRKRLCRLGMAHSFSGIDPAGGRVDLHPDEDARVAGMFSKLKARKVNVSANPLKEFSEKANFKMVLVALFGATMGQGARLVHRSVLCTVVPRKYL